MSQAEFAELAQRLANDVLVWIGFGTLVGLLAKAIMPGRDPGGPIATVLMGIGGTVIGCGAASFFVSGSRVTPISPLGFVLATGGAFLILAFYRVLVGRWLKTDQALGGHPDARVRPPHFIDRRTTRTTRAPRTRRETYYDE